MLKTDASIRGNDASMDDAGRLLDALPRAHAVVLILSAAGVPEAGIAEHLGVPPEAVPTLIEVARRKVEGLLAPRNRIDTGG